MRYRDIAPLFNYDPETGVITNKTTRNIRSEEGVTYDRPTKKFKAQITINGKQKHLGIFHAPELAGYAYLNHEFG